MCASTGSARPRATRSRARRARSARPWGGSSSERRGWGRFAVQRLGRHVRLITRAHGHPEVQVEIDWGDFEQREAYLDEVTVQVRTMEHACEVAPHAKFHLSYNRIGDEGAVALANSPHLTQLTSLRLLWQRG